jgi:hypothetical protein
MRIELEEKLVKRFPAWFKVNGDACHTLASARFRCPDGWFTVIWRLCVDLEPSVRDFERETGEHFEVVKVEADLGALRFYVSHHTDPIDERILEAQVECSRTCEICGQPGKWLGGGASNRVRCAEQGHGPGRQ